jgi:hypothetical protein
MVKRRVIIAQPENFSIPAPEPPQRGRPSPLTDGQLWHRRDRLVNLFSSDWFKYGWHLRRARTARQINHAFADTEHTYNAELLRPLGIESTADFSTLQSHRKEAHAVRTRLGETYKAIGEIRDLWDAIKREIATADAGELRELQSAYQRFGSEWENLNAEYRWLNERDDRLRATIDLQEAAFSQSELLAFIRERRYAWTPVNLGMAVAGLPYMSYRQSVRRCKRRRTNAIEPMEFKIFKAIQYLCSVNAHRLSSADLASTVTHLTGRFQSAAHEFKRNFYFLTKSMEQGHSCRNPEQLPFLIAEAYYRVISSQSVMDRVRNYEMRLSPPEGSA